MKLVFLLVSLFSFFSVSLAQSEAQIENQVRLIGNELRCPVCGGSAITESPSDFARSMLAEVKAQVKTGKSESEIKAYFAGKYGNTVLLKPPFSGITVLVWILPMLILVVGAVVLVHYLRRSSQKPLEATDPVLLEKVRAQLEAQKVQL
jgi:cytochrome c-type biogenesis protein CcmH